MSNSTTVDTSEQGAQAFKRLLERSAKAPLIPSGAVKADPEQVLVKYTPKRKLPKAPSEGWIQPVKKEATQIPAGFKVTRIEDMTEAEQLAHQAICKRAKNKSNATGAPKAPKAPKPQEETILILHVKRVDGEMITMRASSVQEARQLAKELCLEQGCRLVRFEVKGKVEEIKRTDLLVAMKAPSMDPFIASRKRGSICKHKPEYDHKGAWMKASQSRAHFSHG